MQIEQRVKEIAAEDFGLNFEDVTNESTFDDLGADSLDVFEFVMDLEEEFDIEIDEETCENIDNIQGFIDLVKNLSEPDH